MWNPFNRGSDESEQDESEERETEKTVTATKPLTRYRVEVEYAGDRGSETYYCHRHSEKANHVELTDFEPRVGSHYRSSYRSQGIPTRYHPTVKLDEGEPTIISLSNVEDVDITVWEELTAVVEGIPVNVVEHRDSPDSGWEEKYSDLQDDFDPDDYSVTVWNRIEWEAER